MTSISNSFYSNYLNIYSSPNSANSTSYKEIQESNTKSTNPSNEAIQQKINDLLADYPLHHPYYLQYEDAIFYDRVAINGDNDTEFENFIMLKQYLLDNVSLPTEQTFEESKNILSQEMNNILNNTYISKGEDSKEFQALLSFTKTFFEMDKSRIDSKQKLLNLLKQGQDNLEYATSNEFYHKLFTKTEGLSTMTLEEINTINEKQGFLSDYISDNYQVAHCLEEFFALADFYKLIPQENKDKISENLQISQRYLYNQRGDLENHFQLGDFTISWEGNSTLFNAYLNGSKISIASQSTPNDFLASLASNFDTTQSIFDILNQKEKLEKENQDLKNKQAIEAYSYGNGYSSTLTSKTSKEIDSFINQMIKEAKA